MHRPYRFIPYVANQVENKIAGSLSDSCGMLATLYIIIDISSNQNGRNAKQMQLNNGYIFVYYIVDISPRQTGLFNAFTPGRAIWPNDKHRKRRFFRG